VNRYLCVPCVIDRPSKEFIRRTDAKPFEVEAANEADAAVIAKHQQPLAEGETMAVMFMGRILVGNAGSGMPVGQGGGSQKIEGGTAAAQS
jgi:hypothetical protein